ncbi:hypothetical protein [Sanguibacter sp. 25GB23B1]|uniref:hypothetical protein n=1 Tax=unclassified Sanguibacter TaxID=2645534 RepID=UPI0032AF19FA
MVAVAATSSAAAAEFPRKGVLRLNVDRPAAKVRRAVHMVLLSSLVLAHVHLIYPGRERTVALIGLSGETWAFALSALVMLAAFAVMAVDAESVAAWEMFAVGGVVALVEYLRLGVEVDLAIVPAGFLWVVAYFWRKMRHTRQARWLRLRRVVDDHRLVEAEVVRHHWQETHGSTTVHRLRVVLASSQLPGQEWSVELWIQRRQLDAAPETGDRVLVFVCPGDLEVAVVRPVLPA